MTFSMRRAYAIFQKDVKDLTKNLFVITTALLPLILAVFYGTSDLISIETHYTVINLTFAAVAVFIQSALIAEEKEKNTLRGLMLSPATLSEILGGKSALTFLFTIATIVVCSFITGYEPSNLVVVGFAILLSTVFYIALGTLVGLLSKSVMEASVMVLPVMFIFGFGSVLQSFADKYAILAFIEYMPNVQLIELANKVENSVGMTEFLLPLFVIAGWAVVTGICVVIMYKKRALDD
ncbi:ABC transporter permease [Alkalihalobacillus sp. CinArs1]|uniref:ABC transporter permease n=1 Tax=Alkalihalobacillus sp. CinArs1 TaxID=2995314 RepID=UPI0022DE30FF|nr:ABC transporter permease [Alkalihalobacillus sp. CinArs1]